MSDLTLADRVGLAANRWHNRRNRRRVLLLSDLQAGYVPLAKVASTAVRSLLCRRQARLYYPHLAELHYKPLIRAVEKHIRVSRSVPQMRALAETHFLFSFVRNPIVRAYSCYLDKVVKPGKSGEPTTLYRYGMHPDMSFERFVDLVCDIDDERADKHFRSQHPTLFADEQPLVHFIGRQETLAEDWQRLQAHLPLEDMPPVRRRSGAASAMADIPLSAAHRARLVKRYERDIELLGYAEEVARWANRD